MSMLILEDSPIRTRAFRHGFIGACISTVNTSAMAIAWLNDHTPHLICLDYDLDQYGLDRKETGTGYDVARFIASHHRRFSRANIIVHSLNHEWAKKMVALLHAKDLRAYRHPFLWEDQENMARLGREVCKCEITPIIPS